jgi:hypothetical protein
VRWLLVAAGILGLGCADRSDGTLRVERTRVPEGTRLTLIAKSNVQINARLKPALELKDGTVLRFDTPHITADSAYFTAAPELLLPAGMTARGKIRASVCDSGEAVCRLATVALR